MPQNTMIVDRVTYKGHSFTQHRPGATNRHSFMQLKSFGFLEVATKNEIVERTMGHGYYTGITRNTTRTIVMTIGVIATNAQERWRLIKLIDGMFQPLTRITHPDDEYFELSFVDPAGYTRKTNAKVIQRPKWSDYNNDQRIDARVELLPDGRDGGACWTGGSYIHTDRNYRPGVHLSTTLPVSFGYADVQAQQYAGISTAPINVKITALQDRADNGYVMVRSRAGSTNTVLMIRTPQLLQGDVIQIDGVAEKITKNGNDITATADPSMDVIPLMHVGDNTLVVDTGWPLHTVDVERSRSDVWC